MFKRLAACLVTAATLCLGGAHASEMYDLGGAAKGDPSAVWYKFGGQDVVAVFVRGPGDLMYARVGDAGGASWTPWVPIGTQKLKGSPACAAPTPSAIECVGVGANNNVFHIRYNANQHQWSSWQNLGGYATGNPSIARGYDDFGDPMLAVFVAGPGHSLFLNSRQNGAWSDWQDLGVSVGGDVACTDVFGLGDHCYDSTGGSAVQLTDVTLAVNASITKDNLGGAVAHKVSPVTTGANGATLRVFVHGPFDAIWMKKWQGGWGTWTQLDGMAGSGAPGCSMRRNGGPAMCAVNDGGSVKVFKFAPSEL